MAVVVVTSGAPGAGKTGVAAAIARHYAYQGRPVTLVRLPGDGADDEDAAFFADLPFVPGSPAAPRAWESIPDPAGDAITVIETSAGEQGTPEGATVVFVTRGPAAPKAPAGAVVVHTDVPASAQVADGVALREDRILAGFSVGEVRAALNAEVLVEGDEPDVTCDHLVIAPIASDAGQPYFRRFGTKAVVVRFDKTDQHLAAMRGEPQVLVLTGGRLPSDYLFDAARATGTPVLLSYTDTENTVIALEGIFDRTRFTGERKLERMVELLEATPLFERLGL